MFGAVDLSPVVSGMTSALGDLSATNILTVVAGALAITVPLIAAWFGIRWISRKVMGAFKKGK